MSDQQQTENTEMSFRGVYKSLDAVKKCLHNEKHFSLPEVQELLKIFQECCTTSYKEIPDISQRKPFIVLEGIDASGKTTISKKLAKLLGGCQLSTPPPELLSLRNKFDDHDVELRRAYYSMGNYIIAEKVKSIYSTQPIVMDRFWHSTAAYAITGSGLVPEEGHPIYQWPEDLIKPDMVFFLEVSEHKRIERLIRRRDKAITSEEIQIKDDKILRDNLLEIFYRFCDPHQTTVDSNVTVEEVLLQLKNILKKDHQIEMSEIENYNGATN